MFSRKKPVWEEAKELLVKDDKIHSDFVSEFTKYMLVGSIDVS